MFVSSGVRGLFVMLYTYGIQEGSLAFHCAVPATDTGNEYDRKGNVRQIRFCLTLARV